MDKKSYPALTSQIATTVLDGQTVMVLADSGQVTVLNDLGTRIWQNCDSEHNVEQIIRSIVDEYEVDYLTAERDVIEFLERLVGLQALVMKNEPGKGNAGGV
jgi:hypothetical protein